MPTTIHGRNRDNGDPFPYPDVAVASHSHSAKHKQPHMHMHIHDVAIVGGGLSGLALANDIHESSKKKKRRSPSPSSSSSSSSVSCSWKLLEARSVFGGRLANDARGDGVDLGGAWIWPGQRHMLDLTKEVGVETFVQPDDPSSRRVVGGGVRIVEKLADGLPGENLCTGFAVARCTLRRNVEDVTGTGTDSTTTTVIVLESESGRRVCHARRVVFAVPPKVLSKLVRFEPPLPPRKVRAMEDTPTWMAGVTKVCLVYDDGSFWKSSPRLSTNGGLAGRPAFQVYDASTKDGRTSALTFFALCSPSGAADYSDDEKVAEACARQLGQFWMTSSRSMGGCSREVMASKQLLAYDRIHVKRWPAEEYISEDADPRRIQPHPDVNVALSEAEWGGRLFFAGTESDLESPGLMEGAVGAAHRVARELEKPIQP